MLLSDAHRMLKLGAVSLLILAACLYNYRFGLKEAAAFHGYLEAPGPGDGRVMDFPYAMVMSVRDASIRISIKGHTYLVDTGRRRFERNVKVSFSGVKEGPDRVRMLRCHAHIRQKIKLYVSFLPMLVIFWLLGRRYQVAPGRLLFRERH